MKFFLIRIFSTGIILGLVVLLLNKIYLTKCGTDIVVKFENVPTEIDICNLGTSHGLYGFCYDEIGTEHTCFNFALSSQSLEYDKRILGYYKNCLSKNCVVFIPVSYFSLYGLPENEWGDFKAKNRRYYKFLPKELIVDYDNKERWFIQYPVLTAYENIVRIFFGGGENDTWTMQTADTIDLESNVEYVYNSHFVNIMMNRTKDRIINNDNIRTLYEIIEICRQINARPILVTTPFLEEYTNEIKKNSPDFYDEFSQIIESIVQETGVEYYDYACDERFKNNYKLFMNSDHLNRDGATMFTNILLEEVK